LKGLTKEKENCRVKRQNLARDGLRLSTTTKRILDAAYGPDPMTSKNRSTIAENIKGGRGEIGTKWKEEEDIEPVINPGKDRKAATKQHEIGFRRSKKRERGLFNGEEWQGTPVISPDLSNGPAKSRRHAYFQPRTWGV